MSSSGFSSNMDVKSRTNNQEQEQQEHDGE